jgi:flavin-dependent dehydrogenase
MSAVTPRREVIDADVVVVGAGPAGCATAITLRHAGLGVVLVAGAPRPPSGSYRAGEGGPPGLDRTVGQVFGTGVGTFDPDAHLRSYATRSAWGTPTLHAVDHMFNPFGPGWLLDRDAFDARLLDAVAVAGVQVLRDTRMVAGRHDARWHLEVAAAERSGVVTAPFVCDASGRAAVVARARGARVVRGDRLTAVAGLFTDGAPEPEPAITIEAAPDGWWYTAPLPRGRRVVICFTDPDVVDIAAARRASDFLSLVDATDHVAPILASTRSEPFGVPSVFAACSTHLVPAAGPDWLAVGDAAAAFDPLSSQGIVTALLMGREAGRVAADAVGGAPDATAPYTATLARVLDTYRREHAAYYRAEQRWDAQAFWRRRHTPASAHSVTS